MERGKTVYEKGNPFSSKVKNNYKRRLRDDRKSDAIPRIIEANVSKRLILQERESRRRVIVNAPNNNQVNRPYRKHPYHKPAWKEYPTINISKSSENGNLQAKNRNETINDFRKLIRKNEKLYPDNKLGEGKRILGNSSTRNGPPYSTESIYYRVNKISLPWIIKYIARLNLIWEAFMCFTIVATFVLTFYTAFFSFYDKVRDNPVLWECISIADYIFMSDTILRLYVETWRYQHRVPVVVFMIPYTLLQFVFDASSMLPFQRIYHWIMESDELKDLSMIGYFRLNRLLRLTRLKKFFEILERERMANVQLLFLLKFFSCYLTFIYFMACLLVFCIGMQPIDYLLYNNVENLKESFLKRFQQQRPGYGSTPWDICIITINFVTAAITTVGYGDIIPNNELEVIICIICMLLGAIFLNGYYTSKMTTFSLELDTTRFDHFHRLKQIRNYLTALKTLPFFNAKVEEYYNSLWNYRQGAVEVTLMRTLPLSFNEDLLLDICVGMFDKSQLFYNMDTAFLRAVSKTVTVVLYNSNMILCHKGSHSGKMYYILQGECQAMSKLNSANASVIIRAGSIIGEVNLFFSFPYTTTVETITCCQFIMLTRQDLLNVLVQFPVEMEILRSRCLNKINELYDSHQAYGVDPICWINAKTDMESPNNPNSDKLEINMRWGTGFNKEVLEDIVDDSEKVIIFNTPCKNPSVEKNHLIPYISCTIPEILNTTVRWIRTWNYFIIGISLYAALAGPYCLVFSESDRLEHYIYKLQFLCEYVIRIVFVVDVFVEIYGACPTAGLYYKFWDGLSVVLLTPGFYLDILAAIPLDICTPNEQDIFHIIGITFKILKLWKVIRFFHYLDNVYPLQLFWFRLAQFTLSLLYGIHFIACVSFFLACPRDDSVGLVKCKQESWLATFETILKNNHNQSEKTPEEIKAGKITYGGPYMYSFFYGATTLTSAGIEVFSPQNRLEMIWAIVFQLLGIFIIGYYTANLISAVSCLDRPKLAIQQQLASMYQFMNRHNLREHLKNRVIEHFVLQQQLRGSVTLDAHIMVDAPSYLKNDVLYLEVYELLVGIPVFSKLEADLIIKLSNSMNLFLIPPNTTFVHIGDIRRILYVIKNGSMGVFESGLPNAEPVAILETSSHFGIRDLLFGEPSHYIIRSLSYVSIYEIKRREFEETLQYESDFWELLQNERRRVKDVVHDMTTIYASISKGENFVNPADSASSIPSWIKVPSPISATMAHILSQVEGEKIAKINLLNDEFHKVWGKVKWLRLCKCFLLRKTIHPAGCFSKFWNCLMSLNSCLIVLTLMLETFGSLRAPWFRLLQMSLDCVNFVDIYLKLHWSYYNAYNQMLITHPLKTAVHYILHGSFLIDVVICAPIELLIWFHGLTNFLGYGKAAFWYSKLRWIRVFQVKRITVAFSIVRNISKHRRTLFLIVYTMTTLFVCTILATVALFIACPWKASDWNVGDQYKIAQCLNKSWVSFKYDAVDINSQDISGIFRRWILGMYYVSQAFFAVGYGDMIVISRRDVYLLVFMCIFGAIFIKCIVADLAAAGLENDETREKFIEQITVLDLVMKRENVPEKLYSSVMSQLYNTWNCSRGIQPHKLFQGLHPVLESELYGNLLLNKLSKVPIFHSFPHTVLRNIASYMKTLHINRGQRIMRFGNLEYEMYIIISGRVYITDQHLNYICSLGPEETFGEASMVYGMARCRNAIAACNTELCVLTSSQFQSFLERYPDFKNKFKQNLSSEKQDYFETLVTRKMLAAKKLTSEKKHRLLQNFAERTNLIKDMMAQKEDFEFSGVYTTERRFKKHSSIVGRGELDEDLPLLYFAVWRIWSYPVIHPNCRFAKLFQTFIKWMCFITPAIAAYEVSFSSSQFLIHQRKLESTSLPTSKYLHQISNAIEIVFLLNTALNFFIAYEIRDGVYNKRFKSIVLRYLTSFDGLLLHLITSAPYIIEITFNMMQIDSSNFSKEIQSLLVNLYLLRSFRLFYYFKSFLCRKNHLTLCPLRSQMTLSVSSFCLMVHMLACLFYSISPCPRLGLTAATTKYPNLCPPLLEEAHHNKSGWTAQYVKNKKFINQEELIAWKWWLRSIYWVVSTVSTTGFGDIVPVTIVEIAVCVVCMFCGAFMLSFTLSVFTSGITSLTRTKRKYMHQVNLLVKHLSNIGLSEIRKTQVLMYFQALWEISRGVPYHKSWTNLPLSMQIEVAFALFGTTLSKVPFFKDSKQKIFIRQLSSRVTHSLYIPGSYIHRVDDPGKSMFVVYKGVVSGILTMANNEPDLVAIYNPGDAFGRFAALFHQGQYKKSYRAETMTEILQVKQRDILYLAKMFPQFKKLISDYIKIKYQPGGTNKNIFEQPRCKKRDLGLLAETFFMKAAASKNDFPELEKTRREKTNVKLVDEYIKQDRESGRMEEDRVNRNESQSSTSETADQRREEEGMSEELGDLQQVEGIGEDLEEREEGSEMEERKMWETIDPDTWKSEQTGKQKIRKKQKREKRMNRKR